MVAAARLELEKCKHWGHGQQCEKLESKLRDCAELILYHDRGPHQQPESEALDRWTMRLAGAARLPPYALGPLARDADRRAKSARKKSCLAPAGS